MWKGVATGDGNILSQQDCSQESDNSLLLRGRKGSSLPKLLIFINIREHWKTVSFPSSHSQFIASGGNKHHTFSTLDLPRAAQDLFYLDHTLCGVFIKQRPLKYSSARGGLSWAIYWTITHLASWWMSVKCRSHRRGWSVRWKIGRKAGCGAEQAGAWNRR